MHGYARGSLRFEVDDLGDPNGEPVVLLHGFPQDRRCWWRDGGPPSADAPAGAGRDVGGVAGALVDAGYRVLAPDQRGYSPEARPRHRRDYRLELLAQDVLDLADAAGLRRFHVVGHDWGALVGWHLAATAFSRVQTFTALSVPHPQAYAAGQRHGWQALRSWYVLAFQVPGLEQAWRVRDGAVMAAGLRRSGLPPGPAKRYSARLADPAAARGALNWYRALPWSPASATPAVTVPTLQVWGHRDPYVAAASLAANRSWVVGPYTELELAAGHWLPETAADAVGPAVLAHLSSDPGGGPAAPGEGQGAPVRRRRR